MVTPSTVTCSEGPQSAHFVSNCVYHATFNTTSHVKYEEEYRKFNTITAQAGVGVHRVERGVGQQEALMVVVEGEEGVHPREH